MVLFKAVIIAVLASYLTTETLAQTSTPQRTESDGDKSVPTNGDRPRLRMTPKPTTTLLQKSTTTQRPTTARPGTDCGRNKIDQVVPQISNGRDAAIGEFPWHVAVYIRDGNSHKFIQHCGGTLITTTMFLSAAHCFVSEVKGLRDKSMFRVALGKHLRTWHEVSDRIQRSVVKRIIVPPRYKGREGRYKYDIAVVVLRDEVAITNYVDIICMDWDSSSKSLQLADGSVGKAAGWGATATESSSEELQYVELPWISEKKCSKAVKDHLMVFEDNYYTDDKFCAGFEKQNTSVCKGDSGGGLIFRNATTQSYYLRGIVSVSFELSKVKGQCANQLYTGFTDVATYIQDLIQPILLLQ